jgi:hypothetical protein
MKVVMLGAATLLGVCLLAGCADSSGSSTTPTTTSSSPTTATTSATAGVQAVCDARSQLSTDYDALVNDLKAANLGDAKNQLQAVSADVDAVATAIQGLAADKKAAVQPHVDALQSTLGSLGQAGSLSELATGINTAKEQFTAVLDSLGQQAGCSS